MKETVGEACESRDREDRDSLIIETDGKKRGCRKRGVNGKKLIERNFAGNSVREQSVLFYRFSRSEDRFCGRQN